MTVNYVMLEERKYFLLCLYFKFTFKIKVPKQNQSQKFNTVLVLLFRHWLFLLEIYRYSWLLIQLTFRCLGFFRLNWTIAFPKKFLQERRLEMVLQNSWNVHFCVWLCYNQEDVSLLNQESVCCVCLICFTFTTL